jgi:prefoldin subunit 5
MDGGDPQQDIARIEAHIEALAEAIERCRKFSFAAKLAIGAGAAWLVLVLLGAIAFVPYAVIAAMAAVIGGIVLLGSNATTWTQTEDAIERSEKMRADLIGRIAMRVVDGEGRILH